MRRTVHAAAIAAAASIVLIVPAAHATQGATAARGTRHLTGTATCDEGKATLATRVNAAGTERGKVTVTGVHTPRWHGSLALDPAALEHQPHNRVFTAKHGTFSASAKLRDARSLDAEADFISSSLGVCSVSVGSNGDRYVVAGVGGSLDLRLEPSPGVVATVSGDAHHRYRLAFTITTAAGTRHVTTERTAGTLGVAIAGLRNVPRLATFTRASVTVTDETVHVAPQTFSLAR